jgi:hypothetical protein
MTGEFPFKVGDRVRVTGTVTEAYYEGQWLMVKFGNGYPGSINLSEKGIDLENLGPADPADWPPQVGDIWEADGVEYYVSGSIAEPVILIREANDITSACNSGFLKALNPRLIRRRES